MTKRSAPPSQTYQVDLVANFFGCFMILWLIGLPYRRVPVASASNITLSPVLFLAGELRIPNSNGCHTVVAPSPATSLRRISLKEANTPLKQITADNYDLIIFDIPMKVVLGDHPIPLNADDVDLVEDTSSVWNCAGKNQPLIGTIVDWKGRAPPSLIRVSTGGWTGRFMLNPDRSSLTDPDEINKDDVAGYLNRLSKDPNRYPELNFEYVIYEGTRVTSSGSCSTTVESLQPDYLSVGCKPSQLDGRL